MDKTYGRIQILDGRLFFSPNCSRTVDLPPPPRDQNGCERNIFLPSYKPNGRWNYFELDIANYTIPRWWSLPFGWIAYMCSAFCKFWPKSRKLYHRCALVIRCKFCSIFLYMFIIYYYAILRRFWTEPWTEPGTHYLKVVMYRSHTGDVQKTWTESMSHNMTWLMPPVYCLKVEQVERIKFLITS